MSKTYRAIFDGQKFQPLEPIDLPAASEVIIALALPQIVVPRAKPDHQALDKLAGVLYDPNRRTVTINEMEEAGPEDSGQPIP